MARKHLYENLRNESQATPDSRFFEILKGFGIGEKASNIIDELLIFGIDDPDESQRMYFEYLVGNDKYCSANQHY